MTLAADFAAGKIDMAEASRLEMAAFDKLPAELQALVRSSDVEILATDALRVLRECGGVTDWAVRSLRLYVEQVKRQKPVAAIDAAKMEY